MIAWIDVPPVAWGINNVFKPNQKLKTFQDAVGWRMRANIPHECIPAGVPVFVSILVLLPRPKRPKYLFPTYQDATNFQKSIEDSVEGFLFSNDCFVCDIRTRKRFVRDDEKPGFWIECYSLSVEDVEGFACCTGQRSSMEEKNEQLEARQS